MTLKMRTKAEIALVLATLFWGLTFPFIRIVVREISPLQLVFLRGAIAALLFLPFVLLIKSNRKNFLQLLPIGAILGILYFVSYYAQSIGLQTISSGRSAFITNLSVIFVPLLSPIFKRGLPNKNDLISCIIAICGIYFLTNPFNKSGIQIGDIWTLVTAVCFSFQIHILQWAIEHKPFAEIYAFWQVAFIAIFSLSLMPFLSSGPHFFPSTPKAIYALVYLGVIAMVLTTWLQTRYQRYTSPERAAVIYIIEPVFACFFGFLLLDETMSAKNLFGGFLIIFAVLWSYIFKFMKNLRGQTAD